MEFTKEELTEARRQIASTIHKLRETVKTLEGKERPERYKAQITLAARRIKAFEIAVSLIEDALAEREMGTGRGLTAAPCVILPVWRIFLWRIHSSPQSAVSGPQRSAERDSARRPSPSRHRRDGGAGHPER